jgi:hypothetical protein
MTHFTLRRGVLKHWVSTTLIQVVCNFKCRFIFHSQHDSIGRLICNHRPVKQDLLMWLALVCTLFSLLIWPTRKTNELILNAIRTKQTVKEERKKFKRNKFATNCAVFLAHFFLMFFYLFFYPVLFGCFKAKVYLLVSLDKKAAFVVFGFCVSNLKSIEKSRCHSPESPISDAKVEPIAFEANQPQRLS